MNNGYFPAYDQFGQPPMNGLNGVNGQAMPQYQQPAQRPQTTRQSYSPMMQAYQPTFLNMQSNQTSSGVIWVLGEAEASSYLVAPGSEVVMMDSKAPMAYLKCVDANNRPNLRKFRLIEEFDEPPTVQQPQQSDAQQNFVTREEYNRLAADYDRLYSIVEKIAMQMKGVENDDAK